MQEHNHSCRGRERLALSSLLLILDEGRFVGSSRPAETIFSRSPTIGTLWQGGMATWQSYCSLEYACDTSITRSPRAAETTRRHRNIHALHGSTWGIHHYRAKQFKLPSRWGSLPITRPLGTTKAQAPDAWARICVGCKPKVLQLSRYFWSCRVCRALHVRLVGLDTFWHARRQPRCDGVRPLAH